MTSDPSKGIAIENSLSSEMDNMILKHGLKETNEFLKACTNFGMNLAKIETIGDLKRYVLLAIIKKMWVHDKFGILIGIDKGCPSNCSGTYFS